MRDVVVTAINKGQLPVLGFLSVVLVLVGKLPEGEASKLLFEVLAALRQGELWMYPVTLITLVAWSLHIQFLRRQSRAEFDRIGREKTALQSQLTGAKYDRRLHRK
jgi:hypothetical protein